MKRHEDTEVTVTVKETLEVTATRHINAVSIVASNSVKENGSDELNSCDTSHNCCCPLHTLFPHERNIVPSTTLGAFFFRAICIGLTVLTIIFGHVLLGSFYFAYFSHWVVGLNFLYFLSTFLDALLLKVRASNTEAISALQERQISFPIARKAAWVLFEITTHSGVVVVLGFWTGACVHAFRGLKFHIDFQSVFAHGGLMLFTFIDGFMLNRNIKYLWSHWVCFIVPFGTLYIVWTVIHHFSGLGNPNFSEYDTLYPYLDWNNKVGTSSALLAGSYLASFVLFATLRLLNNCFL